MELDQLREFVLLSKTMNFTRTAKELNLSQPALSNHIMKLERELGVTLIDRANQKPQLTLAGSSFLETASTMLNAYDRFMERTRALKTSPWHRFSVQTL